MTILKYWPQTYRCNYTTDTTEPTSWMTKVSQLQVNIWKLKGDMIFHIFTCICNCITQLDVMYTNAFELFLAWFIDFYISTCTKSLLLGRLAHMCCMFFDYVVLWHVAKLEFSSGVHKLWRVQTKKPSMKGVSKQYFP